MAEDIAIKMNNAALPGGIGKELRRALRKADARIRPCLPWVQKR
jgi:hypothetical protein